MALNYDEKSGEFRPVKSPSSNNTGFVRKFFPLEGLDFVFGLSSINDLKLQGVKAGGNNCMWKGISFVEDNGVIGCVSINQGANVPDRWKTAGINFSKSFKEHCGYFLEQGYEIRLWNKPQMGRLGLEADLLLVPADRSIELCMEFRGCNNQCNIFTKSTLRKVKILHPIHPNFSEQYNSAKFKLQMIDDCIVYTPL